VDTFQRIKKQEHTFARPLLPLLSKMIPSIPRLEDYDVSEANGFLPSETPLEVLSDPYYKPWENVVRNLQGMILSRRIRAVVDNMPVLTTDNLQSEAEWRRAYVVLAFMAHAYVWGGDKPAERVPPSISIPFTATCNRLELPLVATYAAVVLWNYKPLFEDEPIDNLENLMTLNTFTGSIDESWFYLVSVAIEARGAPIIPLMLHAIEAARYNNADVVVECLRSFAERLDELGALLQRMYDQCDPHVFYHRIRPFLAGSKNMADAGLPNGVIFDTNNPDDHYVQYSGGSNAQSSIIQFFDLVLGIEHRPTGETAPKNPHNPHSTSNTDPSAPAPSMQGPSANFIHDMRTYMPGPHARFLQHVSTIANIRPYVTAHRHNRALATAYDACLAMLRAFRDKHIQMVSRYIIVKSRESRSQSVSSESAPSPAVNKMNIANASRNKNGANGEKGSLRGTGGTALIPFLKQARDETGEPAIDAWARRLLNNGPGGDRFARMGKIGEHASGEMEIVGLAGVWSVDDSDGGICHW